MSWGGACGCQEKAEGVGKGEKGDRRCGEGAGGWRGGSLEARALIHAPHTHTHTAGRAGRGGFRDMSSAGEASVLHPI